MEVTMARLAQLQREDLPPQDQAVWDRILASRGYVRGPLSVLLYDPPLGGLVSDIGDYLRYHGLLAGADRELGILTAAREGEVRYEWQAHEPIARREGVPSDAIEVVRVNGPLEQLMPHERAIVEVVRALFREHRIPDGVYERALAELGRDRLIELVALAGYYLVIGFVLNGFQVDLPAGAGQTF
jgi:4-carboxymuconolactone decarboxylase